MLHTVFPSSPSPPSARRAAVSGLRRIAALVATLALAIANSATAAPTSLLFEGALRSGGGGPAADGAYDITVALYADAQSQTALWSETQKAVKVVGGAMSLTLGSVTALNDAALATATLIGVRVGSEPELPRQPLHAVAFARFAGVAADLACTGCVSSSEIAFDGDIDLSGNSIKAKNATFSGDLLAKTVTAQSFTGDGSKLTGTWKATGSCKAGEAIVAIAADGTLQCKAVGAGGDGKLSTLTNGLLSNEFTTVATPTTLPTAIPDNTGTEAVAQAVVVESGTVEAISVSVALANSDISKLRVVLLPPDDKVKGITLCDPCGDANVKQLVATYPSPQKPAVGDLSAYIGKSAKGSWTLKVLDSGFCVPQLPGNAGLCDVANGLDGTVAAFSVTVKVLSAGAVQVPGTLVAAGAFQLPTDPNPVPTCNAASKGMTFSDTKKGRFVTCDGADWRTVPFDNACGNGIASGEEECDDGNSTETDACRNSCKKAVCGDGVVWAGQEACDDGNTKDADACSADCSKISGKLCSNGSGTDCNPPGQTLIASSAFVDQTLPSGWVQCLGFINTTGDDLGANAMDNCLGASQLRIRVWDGAGQVVMDVWETNLQVKNAYWSGGQYYDGGNSNPALVTNVCGDLWPCGNNAGFYGSNNGTCGGGSSGWGTGQCISNGNGGQVTVAPGRTGDFELAKNPTSGAYVGHKIAIYKQP